MKRMSIVLMASLILGVAGMALAADTAAAPAATTPVAAAPAAAAPAATTPVAAAPAAAAPAAAAPAAAAPAAAAPAAAAPAATTPVAAAPAAAGAPAAAPAAKPKKPLPVQAKGVRKGGQVKKAAKSVKPAAPAKPAGEPSNIIKHVTAPIAIDGTMESFADVPFFFLTAKNPAKVSHGTISGDADLSAVLKIAEDGKNIYMACEVTQGRGPVNKQNLDNVWNADCVEIYLSAKSDMVKTSRMKKSEFDYQILMVPTSATGQPVIRAFGADLTGAQIKAKATPKGYIVTGLVPLSNLKANDWKPGKSFKFDAAVAKAGEAGVREKKVYWNAVIDAWDNPDQWGVAEIK